MNSKNTLERKGNHGLVPAQDLIDQVLALCGGTPCLVIVEDSNDAELRFARSRTTTNGTRKNRSVTVARFVAATNTSSNNVCAGIASSGGVIDPKAMLEAAALDAKQGGPSNDAHDLVVGGQDPSYGEPSEETNFFVIEPVLRGLKDAFLRAERMTRVLAGFVEYGVSTTYLGISTGLRKRHVQRTGAFHLVGRSADGKQSSWAGCGTTRFHEATVSELETRVSRGLEWSSKTIPYPPGRYEVILPPEAVADLMVDLTEAAGGRDAQEGRSVFSAPGGATRIGSVLSEVPFDLISDPSDPELICAPFFVTGASDADVSVFDCGLPLSLTKWIDKGKLSRLRYHRAGAISSGQTPTPPIDNLILEVPGASKSLEDMIASTERGLLLTCLWYIREVDPATRLLTGLTRDGVYVIQDGAVLGATNNFRFNESPVDLLGRVSQAGAATRCLGREFGEWANRTKMPPIRIPDFHMSSVSQAS